jgi:Lon protease-like protein
MSSTLPMFPLGSVLLPGELLPLHVFEPRYRALVRACLSAQVPEFGVVLIERGSEVGGGDERRAVGAVARIVQLQEAADGRYGLVAVGTHRIRVERWLPDDPYPLAEVAEWGEGPLTSDTEAAVADLASRVRRAAALAVELGDRPASANDELSPDPLLAGYQLASMAPLGAADRYELLCAADPSSRLSRLSELLADVEAMLAFRLGNS